MVLDPGIQKQLQQLKRELESGQGSLRVIDSQGRELPKPANVSLKHSLESKLRQKDTPSTPRLAEGISRLLGETLTVNRNIDPQTLNQVTQRALGVKPTGNDPEYGNFALKTSLEGSGGMAGLVTCTAQTEWLVFNEELERRLLKHYSNEHFLDLTASSSALRLNIADCLLLIDPDGMKLARWSWDELARLLDLRMPALLCFGVQVLNNEGDQAHLAYQQSSIYWNLDNSVLPTLFKEALVGMRVAVKRRRNGGLRGGRPKQVQIRLLNETALVKLYKDHLHCAARGQEVEVTQ